MRCTLLLAVLFLAAQPALADDPDSQGEAAPSPGAADPRTDPNAPVGPNGGATGDDGTAPACPAHHDVNVQQPAPSTSTTGQAKSPEAELP